MGSSETQAALSRAYDLIEAGNLDEARAIVEPSPRIAISWRGLVLRPGTTGSVAVNDTPVLRTRRLHPVDRISLVAEDGSTKTLTLLSCDPVELAIASEALTTEP